MYTYSKFEIRVVFLGCMLYDVSTILLSVEINIIETTIYYWTQTLRFLFLELFLELNIYYYFLDDWWWHNYLWIY